ncbi:E3 ubiquitin-protein ligase RFWD2 isoform X3 [Arapaima gigas]
MSGSRQNGAAAVSGPGSSGGSTGSSNSSGVNSLNINTSSSSTGISSVPGVSSRTLGTGGEGLQVPTLGVPSRTSAVSPGRPGSSSAGGSRKRPLQTPLCNGLINSYEDKSNDFVCPICFEMIEEAHMTKCGHSFCNKCIRQSLEDSNRCPKCNYIIDNVDQLYPNFLVNELILKQKQRSEEKRLKLDYPNGHRWQVFQDVLSTDQENLDLANVNFMLELLLQKKKQLEAESQAAQLQILMEFLKEARRNKQEEKSGLYSPANDVDNNLDSTVPQCPQSPAHSSIVESGDYSQPPGFGSSSQGKRQTWYNSTLASRRKRLTAHFDDLEQCYFSNRMSRLTDDSKTVNQLDDFMECLSKFTRYNSVRPLATLSYASDLYNGSSIVSSNVLACEDLEILGPWPGNSPDFNPIENLWSILKKQVDKQKHRNCDKLQALIMQEWVAISQDLAQKLISSMPGQIAEVLKKKGHVCFACSLNVFVAFSVKLWSTNLDNSVASIEAKANVCCVKFSPTSRYHLAFGCADHCVHYYDLRNTKQPIMVFKGHRKAVSYAKFVNGEEIVSASTDSQLKLWNVNKPHCLRSFKGHINEKNFVGLASNGDYVACGDENNSLYLYYKGLSKTLLTFKFDTVKSVLDKDKKEDDTNEFVSAVCWRALPDGVRAVCFSSGSF